MGKENILLGCSEKFWKKVWEYRQNDMSWYKIAKMTGRDPSFYHRNAEKIEIYLTKYNIRGMSLNKCKTKIPLNSATIKIIRMAARAGMTEQEIADVCEISMSTLQRYKKQNPEIRKVIKTGARVATLEVIDSLQKKAVGFKLKETKVAQHEGVFTDTIEITKHFAPSEKAAELFLVNKADWKSSNHGNADKQEEQKKSVDTKGKILEWIEEMKKPQEGDDHDGMEERDSTEESDIEDTEEGESY